MNLFSLWSVYLVCIGLALDCENLYYDFVYESYSQLEYQQSYLVR